jgi:hypothetical protein
LLPKPDTFGEQAMGYEYRLDFEVRDRAEADRVLRNVPGFDGFNPKFELYSFRRQSTGTMPDADAKIEPSAIYICDYGPGYQVVRDIQAAFSAIGLHAELREL